MRRGSWRSERGQVSIEWAGVLALVALVVAVLWASGLGEKIAGATGTALCNIFGGDCGSGQSAGPREPAFPCVISDSEGKLKASITVFSVKGGGEVKVLRQERSDGTVLITLAGGANLGAEFGIGGGADVDLGGTGVGLEARLKGGVNGQGEGGGTWTFDSGKDADEFVDIVRNYARDGAIKATVPVLGGIATDLFGEDRDVPDPDITYIQAGVGGSVKGDVTAAVELGAAGLEGAALLGVRQNHRTGENTYYMRMKGSGNVSIGALIGDELSGDVDGQLAITFDKDGNPVKASVIGSAGYSGGLDNLNGKAKFSPESPKDWLRGLKLTSSDTAGGRVEFQYDLPLNDEGVRDAFDRFVENPAAGTPDLAAEIARSGEFTARTYSTEKDKYGGGLDAALGLKFGIEGSYEGVSSQLGGAWYANGTSGGVRQWASCTEAAQ